MTAETAAPAPARRRTPFRIAYAALALILLAAIVLELVARGVGLWQAVVFGLAPDLALVYGAAPGLAKGQLHPRAIGAYNLLHRLWGPLALAVAAGLGVVPAAYVVGALAWALHLGPDRAHGYGLRTRDGFQRP
jgi:hypothetical protein